MTFRWRLALAYAALVALALLLGSVINLLALRHALYTELDTSLRRAAERYALQEALVRSEPPPEVGAALDAVNRQQSIRTTEFDAGGREVDWGPSRVGFRAQAGAWQVGHERVYMLRTAQGWVQTSQSDAAARATLARMQRSNLLSAPLLLLLALGAGLLLARRALRPVTQVSALAAHIAQGGKTGERVPPAPGGDELAQLVYTFNDMLARLEAQLSRERLFAYASAHELRTPVAVIRAAASLSLEKDRSAAEYRATLEQIAEVSAEIGALTTRLMTLASAGQLSRTDPVNLFEVALLSAELHSLEAGERGVELRVAASPGEGAEEGSSAPGGAGQALWVQGDRVALVLAAGNLVQNAVRYTPAGGLVRVSCGECGGWAVLSVEDSGPGIPAAEIPRLTQPFQRAQTGGGAGLGLPLAEAIAEAHGGALQLRSDPGAGLRVELRLPPLSASRPSPPSHTAPPP